MRAPDRIGRNAAFAFAAQMSGAVMTAVLTVFLGAQLSAHDYGLFAFAVGVATLSTMLADLGVSASASRFMAEHRDDPPAAAGVFATALRLKVALGGGTALLLIALAGPIASAFGSDDAAWPLRGVAIALFGQSLFLLLFGALEALGQLRYRLLIATVESVAETTTSIALVLLGGGATGAAFGRAAGYTVGLALGIVVTVRVVGRLRRPADGGRAAVPARRIVTYAGPLLVVDAAFRVFGSIDILLVAAVLGNGAQVAAFELPMRLVVFLDYLPGAAAAAVAPRLARRDGERVDADLFSRSMRYLVLVQVLVLPPLLVWPEALLHLLFGDKYPEAPAVLRALVPFVLLSGVAQLATLAVNYLGAASRRVPIVLVMLGVNVVIDLTLLPVWGVVAAGVGTSAAYAVWVPAHLWILKRRFGVPLRPLLATTARALLAAGAASLLLLALGTGVVGLGRMVVGALLLVPVYVAVLLATREVDRAELAALWRWGRSRLPQPASSSS